MPSKTEEYLALAQRTANGLTRYWEHWTDYLTTASRLYKYSFADQLMIYAQRPDATACASFDIWNNRMNRYVRRGAKGIALLDESSGFPMAAVRSSLQFSETPPECWAQRSMRRSSFCRAQQTTDQTKKRKGRRDTLRQSAVQARPTT